MLPLKTAILLAVEPIYKHLFQRIQENKFSFGIYLKNVRMNISIIQSQNTCQEFRGRPLPPANGGQR